MSFLALPILAGLAASTVAFYRPINRGIPSTVAFYRPINRGIPSGRRMNQRQRRKLHRQTRPHGWKGGAR